VRGLTPEKLATAAELCRRHGLVLGLASSSVAWLTAVVLEWLRLAPTFGGTRARRPSPARAKCTCGEAKTLHDRIGALQ
jgi:hypothetical protein